MAEAENRRQGGFSAAVRFLLVPCEASPLQDWIDFNMTGPCGRDRGGMQRRISPAESGCVTRGVIVQAWTVDAWGGV